MYKYTKIETVFKRDVEGTKKLIEGEYRGKSVEYLKDNLWNWYGKNRWYKHRHCLGWI